MGLDNPRISPGHVATGSFTNNIVDGAQAITGLAFSPDAVFVAQALDDYKSIAFSIGALYIGITGPTSAMSRTLHLRPRTDASNEIQGRINSLDAAGFTILWTSKVGTPPVRTYFYLAIAK